MPELPEVQVVVNDLKNAGLPGSIFTGAQVLCPKIIKSPPSSFCADIKGVTIKKIYRRGKFIVFDFQKKGHLLIHLRMTGRLYLMPTNSKILKHEHIILMRQDQLDLRYYDPRKFGCIHFVKKTDSVLGHLGPEPLEKEFTVNLLTQALQKRKRMLKPLLLDQSFIAGLGNIYVDEALWQAGLHPEVSARNLTRKQSKDLHQAIQKVLKSGLRNLGTTLGNGAANFYSVANRKGRNSDKLNVFRRTGQPCPRCNTKIERMVVGQRGTHICPVCQPPRGKF